MLTPSPCHTLSHIPGPPRKYVTHLGHPPIFSRPSTKNPGQKSPVQILYQLFAEVFVRGFVRVGFCPFPLLSQYICYNRKLNITLNSCFICMIKICISVTSHALDPLPPVTNCHTFSDPCPSSVTFFMDGPLLGSGLTYRVVIQLKYLSLSSCMPPVS